ncbi:zinc finger protein 605-like [Planococcus citri]|uniref:zinc finger protein 605-like n=1 Tax=Planococcus citri TaxID=170843 RepID=UPI0031F7E246
MQNSTTASPSKRLDRNPENEKLFMCLTCEKIFADITQLRLHKKRMHEIEQPNPEQTKKDLIDSSAKFTCSFCPFTFRRRCDKEKHEQDSHTGSCLYTCSFCWCTFNNLAILRTHINRFHRECHNNLVSTVSKPAVTAKKPADIESERRKMKIRKMNLRRNRKPSSKVLSNISSGYVQKILPKPRKEENAKSSKSSKFENKDILTVEESLAKITTTNVKKPRTKKRLITPGGVEMVYTNELCCSYCPNTFATISSKLRHERFHTGVRPFTCKLCKTTFYWERSMITHKLKCREVSIDTHIWCNYCDFHHKQEVVLEQHYRNFHEVVGDLRLPSSLKLPPPQQQVIRFSCGVCDATFNSKLILNRHVWKNHQKKDHTRKNALKRLEKIVTQTSVNSKSVARQKELKIKNTPKFRQHLDSTVDEDEFSKKRDYVSEEQFYPGRPIKRVSKDLDLRVKSLFEDDEQVSPEEDETPVSFNFCDVNLDSQFEANFPNLRVAVVEDFANVSETLKIEPSQHDPLKIGRTPTRAKKHVEPVVKDYIVIDDDD